MKKAVVLVLVLIVVFSSQLFSETLDCQQSFELGKVAAKEEHGVWGWYLLGIGINVLGTLPLYTMGYSLMVDALFVGLLVINTATFVPAILLPKRSNISPSFSGVELECYRDGYKRRASWKNCGAVLLGELTSQAVVFVVSMLFFRDAETW